MVFLLIPLPVPSLLTAFASCIVTGCREGSKDEERKEAGEGERDEESRKRRLTGGKEEADLHAQRGEGLRRRRRRMRDDGALHQWHPFCLFPPSPSVRLRCLPLHTVIRLLSERQTASERKTVQQHCVISIPSCPPLLQCSSLENAAQLSHSLHLRTSCLSHKLISRGRFSFFPSV